MSNDLIIVREKITIAQGSESTVKSFVDIPNDKYALIELFSFKLVIHGYPEAIPDPIELWAHPGTSGPPYTKLLFFPINKAIHGNTVFAGTHPISFRLEPRDTWGVKLSRINPTNVVFEYEIYLSGFRYPVDTPLTPPTNVMVEGR